MSALYVPPRLIMLLMFASGSGIWAQNDWPHVRTGIWEESGTRMLPSGKKTEATGIKIRLCGEPESIFKSWAGSSHAKIEKSGCAYISKRTSENTWEIIADCDLRTFGRSMGKSTVTLKNDMEFESFRQFKEGNQTYTVHLFAKRIAECPK